MWSPHRLRRACFIEILPASPIAWISLSATKALYSWMPMALSESLCIEIDIVSINSLLTLLIPELGAKMIIMKYDCVGIGVVKMTVGVRRRIHEKVQYCITALEI